MDKLKLNIGDKVPVMRMGPVTERPATFDGKTKMYYDNPVRVVETGNEMVWSHTSHTAQQKLESAAAVGDKVTIERMALEGGKSCYVFHTSDQAVPQEPALSGRPSPTTPYYPSPLLRAYLLSFRSS